jgi:hypothetical protein
VTNGNDAVQEVEPLHAEILVTPSRLREQACAYVAISQKEHDPDMRRAYASVAYALAQLGECIERRNKAE